MPYRVRVRGADLVVWDDRAPRVVLKNHRAGDTPRYGEYVTPGRAPELLKLDRFGGACRFGDGFAIWPDRADPDGGLALHRWPALP